MEPPEKDRVSLNAARRSLERTEMASSNDNWSGQGSYLNPDSLRHKGTSTLELEESGTKELERQLLYAKGDARQAEERAAVKVNQIAKEAAEKIAASDLRLVELRVEAERSGK